MGKGSVSFVDPCHPVYAPSTSLLFRVFPASLSWMLGFARTTIALHFDSGLDYGEISSGRGMDDVYDTYGPTYDNDFLPLNPHMSASMGIFNDVEVVVGE